ncbi:MAG TPA: hypothetical protein VN436_03695 [Holophaga sp.]|nr:hypothetical protein [Holophaga sp.]
MSPVSLPYEGWLDQHPGVYVALFVLAVLLQPLLFIVWAARGPRK